MAIIDERLLNVDRHGALAVPGALWLVFAFLARYWIVAVFVLASARRSPETMRVLGGDFSWYMLALEVPTFLVVYAAGSRKPHTGAFLRAVWANGRAILVAIAALHIAAAAAVLVGSSVWRRWPELFIASCALLDIAIVYALLKDAFFRQLFADFPDPEPPPAPAAGTP